MNKLIGFELGGFFYFSVELSSAEECSVGIDDEISLIGNFFITIVDPDLIAPREDYGI